MVVVRSSHEMLKEADELILRLDAKLREIAAIERLSEDPRLYAWQHHAGFNDCLDIVHEIVNRTTAHTDAASGARDSVSGG